MLPRRRLLLAIFVAPIVALAIGVWAEFAHLTPPLLFAVAVPAIMVSTVSAAYLTRRVPWALALVVAGAMVGTITFGLAEGTHVAIHFSRGKTIDFGDYHSRAAIGAMLIGIHLAAGALVGRALAQGWPRSGPRAGSSGGATTLTPGLRPTPLPRAGEGRRGAWPCAPLGRIGAHEPQHQRVAVYVLL